MNPDGTRVVAPAASYSKVDETIGMRIRSRRLILGLSQQDLGEMCGMSPQQVHKYERGINSIRPYRLVRVASVLGVPVSYFFSGLETHREVPNDVIELLADPKLAHLAGIFCDIPTDKQKDVVVALAESLIDRDDEKTSRLRAL